MENKSKLTTVLSFSKGVEYGFVYSPVIGQVKKEEYPMIHQCRRFSKTPMKTPPRLK